MWITATVLVGTALHEIDLIDFLEATVLLVEQLKTVDEESKLVLVDVRKGKAAVLHTCSLYEHSSTNGEGEMMD